jgi:hypothetical protein
MARTLIIGAASLALGGCITHEETEYRDVERVKMEFESDTAARIFYEALSKAPVVKSGKESSSEINIPVVFSNKKKVVAGKNAGFNRAVELCDTNKDAKITELEAKIYAEQVQPKH